MPSLATGAAVSAGGSILGGALSAGGALLGSQQQQKALQSGIQTQIAEQTNLAGLLAPYLGVGESTAPQLAAQIPNLTKPFNPTMDQLAQTPGYNFTLQQGLQTVGNAYSGQGLGNGVATGATASTPSGPGVKGALNYAQGLAASTYQQQFQNYLAQNSQIYNMLAGGSQLGEQAAAAWGGVAQNTGASIAGLQSGIGAAQAAGTIGGFNALSQGVSGASNAIGNYTLLNSLGGGSLNSPSASDVAAAAYPGVNNP